MATDEKEDKIFFEVRCPKCAGLICRAAIRKEDDPEVDIEVICRKCRNLNIIHLQAARKRNNIRKSDRFPVAA